MKKLRYEKIFKATLATTVAAGAFVAIAPVNTEAATKFSDVRDIPTHDFYEAVMNYTAKGMMSGYPDGTFKPFQSITRQDAAKLLALALDLDTVNVKNPGFKDVSPTNHYYGYIAALVEAGIITGYDDKTFKPGNSLTRAQMSKIIVLGFEFQDKSSAKLPFKDIKDKDWHVDFVRALYTNKITVGTTATTFSPNKLVTRGQMASFVFRSEATVGPKQSVVDKAAVDAAENQLKAGAVTVSRGKDAADAVKLAAVQTYATSLITDKSVTVKVAASTAAGNYVVTLTKGQAKVDKTIAMTFDHAADDRFVTEVTAINAKQVEVKFATPVAKTTVLDTANEVRNMTFTMISGSTVNPGKLKGSLSDDGKTLTITANWTFDGEYAFKSTDAIQSSTNGKFEEYTTIVKANDKEAPKLVSGSAAGKVSTNSFALFFDEPVSAAGVIAYVNDGSATVVNNPTNPNRLDVTSNKQVAAGTTAKIKLLNVKDYNHNVIAPNPVETTITISADTIAPTVTNVNVLGENKVEITYNKDMNINSFTGKARLVYSNGTVTNLVASAGSNANTVILTGTGLPATNNYNAVLFIDADVKDTVGNSTVLYSSSVTLSKDTTAPAFISVDYKDGKIIANFTEDIALGRTNTVTVIDQKTGQATQISLNNNNTVIANNTLTIAGYLPNGAYQLRLPANTVVDKAGTPNPNTTDMQAFVVQNSSSTDSTRPVIGTISSLPATNRADQTVTYTVTDFDSGVNLESVQELSNYSWDNNPLPRGSYVTTDARSVDKVTSVTVTIYIPSSEIPVSKQAPFTINNIRDNAENTIGSAAVQNIFLYGGYQYGLELSHAYIDAKGTSMVLTFNDAINSLNVNDFDITLNKTVLPASSIASITSINANTFDVKIKASEAYDAYYNGKQRSVVYYFDENNDGVFNERTEWVIDYEDFRYNQKSSVLIDLNSNYIKNVKVHDYRGKEVIVKR